MPIYAYRCESCGHAQDVLRKISDPVLTACHITAALQSIVARNISPSDTAVVSVTSVTGGDAYNVIPETATIRGTARAFRREVMEQIEQAMTRIASGVAAGFGAIAETDFRFLFAPTVNDAEQTRAGGSSAIDARARPAPLV